MAKELTFGNLKTLIDTWTVDLQEYHNIFVNQSEEFKNVVGKVHLNDQKINLISVKLGVLNYMNQQLEQCLLKATLMEHDLEHKIIKLEQDITSANAISPLDTIRTTVYSIAPNIDCYINIYKNDIELLATETKKYECEKLKIPTEQVVKVMATLLETLQYIEMKIEQMKNDMNDIDYLRKTISWKYGI